MVESVDKIITCPHCIHHAPNRPVMVMKTFPSAPRTDSCKPTEPCSVLAVPDRVEVALTPQHALETLFELKKIFADFSPAMTVHPGGVESDATSWVVMLKFANAGSSVAALKQSLADVTT